MAKSVFKWVPILPKQLNLAALDNSIVAALLDEQRAQGKEFGKTHRTWKHKPGFKNRQNFADREMWAETTTDDFVYCLLDRGPNKRSWIIRPRRSKSLSFRGKYRAKTSPGWVGSRAGGASGKPVFRKVVHHPGFAARRWSDAIAKSRIQAFRQNIDAALSRWL